MTQTPKEKAEELFNKYFIQVRIADTYDNNSDDANTEIAIDCALIACDTVMEASTIKLFGSGGRFVYIDEFWQQVKSELEKMKP